MDVVVVDVTPGELAHDRRRVEHGVLCHTARRFVEAHRPFPLLCGRKRHRLNLNERAEEPGDPEAEHPADRRGIGCFFATERIEATDLCDLVNILFCYMEGDVDCFT